MAGYLMWAGAACILLPLVWILTRMMGEMLADGFIPAYVALLGVALFLIGAFL